VTLVYHTTTLAFVGATVIFADVPVAEELLAVVVHAYRGAEALPTMAARVSYHRAKGVRAAYIDKCA
jgi:hypothetical protein